MGDTFSTYHPIVNLLYFVFVIGVSMFLMHPVFLSIGLICATIYCAVLQGMKKTVKGFCLFTLPMIVIVALINPMFNHYGVTVLFYLYNGNPITLESMVYGVAMAAMLAGVVLWFRCYNEIMTSDKFIYLFGRVIPALSLILSMCLRFIPKFSRRMQVISNGQKCIGRDVSNGNLVEKLRHGITSLSILITWSLESAIESADSMKARGYGLKGRTAFSIYHLDKRDRRFLMAMAVLAGSFFAGCIRGHAYVMYNPKIRMTGFPPTVGGMLTYGVYGLFCLLPVLVDAAEGYRWARLRGEVVRAGRADYRLWDGGEVQEK
jgi:energy-coupling factor transport system permease protein